MTTGTGVVTSARVTHEHATLDGIEAACVGDDETAVSRLLGHPAVSEAFVLQTCHRVEAYVVTPDQEAGRRALDSHLDVPEAGVYAEHEPSLRHLLRVAAGLESLVIGEGQVLGQVRDARETADAAGALGPVLEDAVLKAVHVGERARTETAINEGAVSLGSAAARLAERERGLLGEHALVVGAGEMGRLAAEALASAPVAAVAVANRTPGRAEQLADALPCDARGVGLDALAVELERAGVVVTATGSPEPVVDATDLAAAGDVLVVDLGQPRDVAPGAAGDAAAVFDLDDIEAVTDDTERRRRAAASEVAALVDAELDNLLEQFKARRADDVISGMYAGAEATKARELETAFDRLGALDAEFTDEQRAVVEDLADALVSQLLAAPTRSLRAAATEDDWETISTAIQLFDPDDAGGADGAPSPGILADVDTDADGMPDWVPASEGSPGDD